MLPFLYLTTINICGTVLSQELEIPLLALRSIGKSTVTNKDGFLAFPMFLLQQF
jgi:hypothetical protein